MQAVMVGRKGKIYSRTHILREAAYNGLLAARGWDTKTSTKRNGEAILLFPDDERRTAMREIVRLENLDEIYQAENGEITALEGISFSVYEG